MREIALLLGMLVVTFFTRFAMIALLGKVDIPPWAQRAFRLVLPAVMMAIVLPQVLVRNGAITVDPLNPRLWGTVVAGVIAWKTKSLVLTLLLGMITVWAFALAGVG